jgi:hypothetical protein
VGKILRPDGFAIGLFALGIAILFVPLMIIPGFVAILAAIAYWLTMVLVKLIQQRN